MPKRTYSQRDKRGSVYSRHGPPDRNGNPKRVKIDGLDGSYLRTPPPSRSEKTSSVLKKGPKMFGGPISIPDDTMESEVTVHSKTSKGLSRLFDKASTGGLKPAHVKCNSNIHGSMEQFANAMKDRKRSSQTSSTLKAKYLPTPPAEVPKTHHKAEESAVKSASKYMNSRTTPTKTSLLFERIIKDQPPKQSYIPKVYQAAKTSVPSKTILGNRLPKQSKEAHR